MQTILRLLKTRLLTIVLEYVGWILCLAKVIQGEPYEGVFIVFLLLCLHIATKQNRLEEVILILTVALMGTLIDSSYIWLGMMKYSGEYPFAPWIAPLWVSALWGQFATGINYSFAWFRQRIPLAACFGAFFAPLSYSFAVRVGAGEFLVSRLEAMGIIAVVWTLVFPTCFYISDKLKVALGPKIVVINEDEGKESVE